MNGGVLDDGLLDRLRERQPRFHEAAYLFILTALNRVIDTLPEPRHISGRELTESVRDLALDKFGPMARTVLEHWGIRSTEDVGQVVFALVDTGVLIKQETDLPDDFVNVFDFEDAFERRYPWHGSGDE
jgi:uncharacterized repeat protein (TIGR04138 family)